MTIVLTLVAVLIVGVGAALAYVGRRDRRRLASHDGPHEADGGPGTLRGPDIRRPHESGSAH